MTAPAESPVPRFSRMPSLTQTAHPSGPRRPGGLCVVVGPDRSQAQQVPDGSRERNLVPTLVVGRQPHRIGFDDTGRHDSHATDVGVAFEHRRRRRGPARSR